jgi:hypothetical protein
MQPTENKRPATQKAGEIPQLSVSRPYASAALRELMTQVRPQTGLQRITVCNGPRAIAARGTSDQLALAQQLIQQSKL